MEPPVVQLADAPLWGIQDLTNRGYLYVFASCPAKHADTRT